MLWLGAAKSVKAMPKVQSPSDVTMRAFQLSGAGGRKSSAVSPRKFDILLLNSRLTSSEDPATLGRMNTEVVTGSFTTSRIVKISGGYIVYSRGLGGNGVMNSSGYVHAGRYPTKAAARRRAATIEATVAGRAK